MPHNNQTYEKMSLKSPQKHLFDLQEKKTKLRLKIQDLEAQKRVRLKEIEDINKKIEELNKQIQSLRWNHAIAERCNMRSAIAFF